MKGQDMKLRAAHSRVWGQQNPVQRGAEPWTQRKKQRRRPQGARGQKEMVAWLP